MKIGMISNSWRPVRCGVTTVLEDAAAHLNARGHEVVFIAPAHPASGPEEFPTVRLPSMQMQSDYRAMVPWLSLHPAFRRAVRDLGCDLIHAHDSLPFGAGHVGVQISRRLGVPLVITHHCFYESVAADHCHSRPVGRLLAPVVGVVLRTGMRYVLRAADLVLAPAAAAAAAGRRFRPQGAEVLPSGVEPPAVRPDGEVRRHLGLTNGTRMLINVGRQHPDKNLNLLLEAFASSRRAVPDSLLVLVGEGPQRPYLERRARELGVAERVRFAGVVPHQEIWGWYAAADLLVSTSRETQGLVLLEAMHMGVPVVAMQEGGASSVVRDGTDGLLVPAAVEAVSGAVTTCLSDRSRYRRMSEEARLRARQFDPKALISELERHYLRVLDTSRANCEPV